MRRAGRDRQVLAEAVSRLPERERTVLALYYVEAPHAGRDRPRRSASPRAGCPRSTPRPSSTSAPAWPRPTAPDAARSDLVARPDLVGARPRRARPRSRSVAALRLRRRPVTEGSRRDPALALLLAVAAAGSTAQHRQLRAARRRARSSTTSGRRPALVPGQPGDRLRAPRPARPCGLSAGGVVTFAGSVAGDLFVIVAHADGLRTTYAYLASVRRRGPATGWRARQLVGTQAVRAPLRGPPGRRLPGPGAAVPAGRLVARLVPLTDG